jgi:adenine deaminase
MTVMLRQSSVARDMERLMPAIPPPTRDRCLLVTDDLLPQDLLHRGHMDAVLRDAVRTRAVGPIEALRMVTLNAAHHFGLPRVGAVAPGWRADLVVFEDLRHFRPRLVLHGGRVVAEDGRPTVPVRGALAPGTRLQRSVRLGPLPDDVLRIPARAGRCRAIPVQADSILKLTDRGLVDVDAGRIVPLWLDGQEGRP